MKKTFIAFLVLASFGIASSAHAFLDPINTPVTAIFGGPVAGITAPRNKIDDQKAVCAQAKDQRGEQAKIGSNKVNLPTLPMVLSFIGANAISF